MRVAFNRWPSSADGRRYLLRPQTSDRDGPPHAHVDTYRERARLESGETTAAAFDRLRRRLFDYEMFSPRWVGYRVLPELPIRNGCVVVQRLGAGVIFLESATRVIDVWSMSEQPEMQRSGFAYVTLRGHPECGVATFEVCREGDAIFVVLKARSVPGTMLTKLASPLTRFVQRMITMQAVRRLTSGRS
jgi:uncharacterized protein (UPF0548 family)